MLHPISWWLWPPLCWPKQLAAGLASAVGARRELLTLVSLTTLFVVYGIVFYEEMRDYFSARRTKPGVAE
jgi:hypothetical protein